MTDDVRQVFEARFAQLKFHDAMLPQDGMGLVGTKWSMAVSEVNG